MHGHQEPLQSIIHPALLYAECALLSAKYACAMTSLLLITEPFKTPVGCWTCYQSAHLLLLVGHMIYNTHKQPYVDSPGNFVLNN